MQLTSSTKPYRKGQILTVYRADGRHVHDVVILSSNADGVSTVREARWLDYFKEWIRDQYIDIAFEAECLFPEWVSVWQEDS